MKRLIFIVFLIFIISLTIFWFGSNMQNIDCGPQCPVKYDWDVLPVIFLVISAGFGITYLLIKLKI